MQHKAFNRKNRHVELKVARVVVNFVRRVGDLQGNNSVQKGLLVFGRLRMRKSAHFNMADGRWPRAMLFCTAKQ